jgi:hypothetical protein
VILAMELAFAAAQVLLLLPLALIFARKELRAQSPEAAKSAHSGVPPQIAG